MTPMTPELILTWHDYFVTVAQASATLAGLLFVGVTISLNHLLQGRGYLVPRVGRALPAVRGLADRPFWRHPRTAGSGAWWRIRRGRPRNSRRDPHFRAYFPEDEASYVLGSKGARVAREVLLHVAILLPVASGLSLLFARAGALYWLIPGEVISLYLSIGLAWVFAVEIPRRMELQKSAAR